MNGYRIVILDLCQNAFIYARFGKYFSKNGIYILTFAYNGGIMY